MAMKRKFSVESVSDKESLKKSLVHVDQFLKKVGRGIETERNLLQSVGRRNANSQSTSSTRSIQVTVEGVSDEDYAKVWFGGNKFNNNPPNLNTKKDSLRQSFKSKKEFSNFYKAVATLDEEELKKGTTKKLIIAVSDLKGLIESDVDIKNKQNTTKLDMLRKLQAELKKKDSKNVNKIINNVKKSKRDNDDNEDVFDVFGGMDFPEDSNLPNGITTKETPATGGGTPPEVLDEKFIIQEEMPGPGHNIMMTPSTTTDDNEPLLNPKQFGYTTTHKPLQTYGDILAPPEIPSRFLTTTEAPSEFVASLKDDMEKFQMGVFSIAALKVFHMVIWKNQAEAQRIVYGLGKIIDQLKGLHRFDDFGEPTKEAISKIGNRMASMPYDEMRSEVIMLHNALLHRRELFSTDLNSVMDHIDMLYSRAETNELLKSLEPLEAFHDGDGVPYTILNTIIDNILAPWKRLKNTPRGNILKEALNRAIKNHFYTADHRFQDSRRTITINIPVGFRPVRRSPASTTQPNFRSIEVYSVDSRKDVENKNIYNTDLRTIFNNFMRNRNIEQARKNQAKINAKPQFNKELKSNLNIVNKEADKRDIFNNKNEKQTIRINLNAKVTSKPTKNRIMIITNNNQAKSNIMNKPRALFRNGDSVFDFNVVNNQEKSNNMNKPRAIFRNGDSFIDFNMVNNQEKIDNINKPRAIFRSGDTFIDFDAVNNQEKTNNMNKPRAMFRNSDSFFDVNMLNANAKRNIMNKPRAMFRSGDSYVDFNVVNMSDMLVHDVNQFDLDMYPDVPLLVTDPPPPPPPSELNFQIEGDKLNLQVDGDQKLIVINKKNDAPIDAYGEDTDLKMASSSALRKRKHHKKHHKKHKRKHAHNSLREKLAKIKRIVKIYRSGRKKSKHHHRSKHKKELKSLSIKDPVASPSPHPITRNLFNATKVKAVSDKRFQLKDSPSTTSKSPSPATFAYTTQVYAVRNNFMNNLRRKMMIDDVHRAKVRQESVQSDEEIALRKNLYRAMGVKGRGLQRSLNLNGRRTNGRRRLLRDSSGSDEEALLKNRIYSYFNNIQPE